MLSVKIFELLDAIGKAVRKNIRPFGGIQIILSGDFYQLPPVGSNDDITTSKFCFESVLWCNIFNNDNQIQLIKNFRQKNIEYINILNQIRTGSLKKKTYELLTNKVKEDIKRDTKKCVSDDIYDEHSFYTKIYPTRHMVSSENEKEMKKLDTNEFIYKTKRVINNISEFCYTKKQEHVYGNITQREIDHELSYIESTLSCDSNVYLKIGSRVMCVINTEIGENYLCNGSQGIVIRFTQNYGHPVVKFMGIESPITIAPHSWMSEKMPWVEVTQIPLILAWAITIHKSQGSTLDRAEIDVVRHVFECGQTYVALSRVKTLEGLKLTAFDINKITVSKKVQKFYNELKNTNT
jgi:ATP-dependent DNA helicase PIF1